MTSYAERKQEADHLRAIKARMRWPGTYLLVGATGEVWRLSFNCPIPSCKKPTLYAGRCYQCATGRDTTPDGMKSTWKTMTIEKADTATQRPLGSVKF